MRLLLNPRVWIALALAGLLAFSHLIVYRSGRHAVQAKWNEAVVAQERAAQEQAARNRDLQRLAEQHFHALAGARDEFFHRAEKEIHDAAAPLAACPIPPDLRRMLDAADACARGDTGAACGAAGQVPAAR